MVENNGNIKQMIEKEILQDEFFQSYCYLKVKVLPEFSKQGK